MTAENLFVFFSLGMVFNMLGVLFLKNSVLAVISLIGFFLNGSALLFFFKADYLGIVYVIVYVGAIAVLFLFVVMMLDFKHGSSLYDYNTEYFFGSFFFVILFFIYLYNFFFKFIYISYNVGFFKSSYVYKLWVYLLNPLTDISTVGFVMFNYYSLYFLICGLLLFVAMVGAIILTLFKRENVKVQSLSDQVLRSPKVSVYLYNSVKK
jgi:NADH-quinone oxidoreductase subunit J